jgi:hypothetical protein
MANTVRPGADSYHSRYSPPVNSGGSFGTDVLNAVANAPRQVIWECGDMIGKIGVIACIAAAILTAPAILVAAGFSLKTVTITNLMIGAVIGGIFSDRIRIG